MDTVELEDDRYHVAASASLTAGGTRVLQAGDTFALLNRFGDMHREGGNEQGLYHRGTRFLARLELRISGRRPLFLSSGMLEDNIVLAVDLSNPDLRLGNHGEGDIAYGTRYRDEALAIMSGLYGASKHVELNRLPELFCGFARKSGQGPTLYPVACSPQAWAAGAVFLLLKAVLGMDLNAIEQRITFRSPALPDFIDELWLTDLRVGAASVDLRLQRYPGDVGINVVRKISSVQVSTLR